MFSNTSKKTYLQIQEQAQPLRFSEKVSSIIISLLHNDFFIVFSWKYTQLKNKYICFLNLSI